MVKVEENREEDRVRLTREDCCLSLCQFCPMIGCVFDNEEEPDEPTRATREVDWLGDRFGGEKRRMTLNRDHY